MTKRPLATLSAAGALFVLAGCAGSTTETSGAAAERTGTDSVASTAPPTTTPSTTTPSMTSPPTTASQTTVPATTAPPTTSPQTTSAPDTTAAPESDRDFTVVGSTLRSLVDANGLNGAGLVVVDREEGIVHQDYVGEFTADRVSLIASSSKMITAGVLLHLEDEGLLDLDAPVADAVEWGSANSDITPAQLVSNSSGLVGLLPNPAYGPYLCQLLPTSELEECGAEIFQTDADDSDVIAPDTEFRYGGAQWQVAGAIAEAVSGKTWAELIDEIYVQPCGVASLGYNNHWAAAGGFDYPDDFDPADLAPTENPQMEGGGYITPPDYAALLLMHLRGGMCDGGRVLSEESVARAHADRVAESYGENAGLQPGYGLGWWVNRENGIVSDGGAYGSLPWLDVDAGYGAYLVIEASSGLGSEMFDELSPLVASAMS
jgi:CubicO group peptidase (beta-lactamase class C family)